MCVTRLVGEVFQIHIKHEKVFECAMCRDDLLEYVPQVRQSLCSPPPPPYVMSQFGERYRALMERTHHEVESPPSYDDLPSAPEMTFVDFEYKEASDSRRLPSPDLPSDYFQPFSSSGPSVSRTSPRSSHLDSSVG
jgi:hypothetical protein